MTKNTICPYLLTPLDSLKISDEHIIPLALGGPDTFVIKADEATNNNLGDTIDAGLINDDLAKAAAAHFGLKTRSGPAQLKLRGNASLGSIDIPMNLTLGTKGDLSITSAQPVIPQKDGYLINGTESQIAKKIKEIYNSTAQANVNWTYRPVDANISESKFKMKHDFLKKTCGLLKIGYLALARTFGDEFVLSKSAEEFRKGFQARTQAELHSTDILGYFMADPQIELNPNEKHIIIAVRGYGAYCVYVSLFHEKAYTRQFSVIDGSLPKKTSFEGKKYLINARQRRIEAESEIPMSNFAVLKGN